MSDAPSETPAESHEGTQEDRIDSLESKVDAIGQKIDQILGLGRKPEQPEQAAADPEPEDIAATVRSEVKKIRDAEDRKAKADARDKEVSELKETVAKIKERPPKEYRKVTNLVWGRDED